MGVSQARSPQSSQRQTAAAAGNTSPPGSARSAAEAGPVSSGNKAASASALPASAQAATAELHNAVQEITAFMQSVDRALEISVDDDLGTTVITIVDRSTQEVVRQIPNEEAVAVARFLAEQQAMRASDEPPRGLLLDSQG